MSTNQYPRLRRSSLVEDLHGYKVPDPFRWLEDPNSDDTKEAFIQAENTISEEYISKFPHIAEYRESLTKAYNYERYGTPFRCGDRWYYSYNSGLQAQSVCYTLDDKDVDNPEEKGTVFFDPNLLSEDGTLALNTQSWSNDGSLYAYALSQSGSDWCSARIRKVPSGDHYPETLEWLKFTSLQFTNDNMGLFYMRYPEPQRVKDAGTETGSNANAKLYYHFLGTDQSEDILIYFDPKEPEHTFGARTTFDGNWVIMNIYNSTAPVNKLWLARLENKRLPSDGKLRWIRVKDDFDSALYYFENRESVFYFQSTLSAPRRKVVRYDLDKPDDGFVTIIPEQPVAVLEAVTLANQKYLYLTYLHNVQNKVLIVPLGSLERQLTNGDSAVQEVVKNVCPTQEIQPVDVVISGLAHSWVGIPEAEELELPVGSIIYSGARNPNDRRIFIYATGYTLPGRIYKYQFYDEDGRKGENLDIVPSNYQLKKTYGKLSIYREAEVQGVDPHRWEVEQVWVPNPNDGVKIPMFIIRDKSFVKRGDSFCLLYGYGGFNLSMTPKFSSTIATMLTHSGGLYCVANIRGGGEFGEDWHKAAIRENRPVAFSDFEECGRYLIREGWTKKEKLVCQGGSNGGTLIGAVMNRTGEDIFAAGVAQVGVLDMLRYHLFTIGHAWKSDYGDPDVKEDFEFLYKWSPYHNVRAGCQYPAVWCETSDHDDRVVPLHSFKYIAALQDVAGMTNHAPLLLRHHLKAGHGAGKPIKKIIEEATERFAFMMLATGTPFIPTDAERLQPHL